MWDCASKSIILNTVGKNKLSRFREMESFEKVYQPPFEEVFNRDFHLKGHWKKEVFGNDNSLTLELGCGKGEYTTGLAGLYPERNFMGLDIKGARIWRGARDARDAGMENVAFLRTRIDFISSFFAREEVDELWITFPDPQEKRRRRKKRLTGALFLNRYREILRDGGLVSLKTDNLKLYNYTLELARFNKLHISSYSGDIYAEGWDNEITSIQTYYESRFRDEGIPIKYIGFQLPSSKEVRELPAETEDRIYGEG